MLSSLSCPFCQEPLAAAENAAAQTDSVTCPHCGQSVDRTPFRAGITDTGSLNLGISEKPSDEGSCVVDEIKSDISLAESALRSPRRLLGRVFAVSWMIVLLLLLGLSIPGYQFVRDRYNPWLTEASWKRIQSGMTLEEVEGIISKGKPCTLEDVKAVVDPVTNKRKEMEQMAKGMFGQSAQRFNPWPANVPQMPQSPFPQNGRDDWDAIDDLAWQAKRQKAVSWYRWKRGATRLFVGVNSENKVRLACRITDSSDVQKAGISWVYSAYPFADMELIERTGKSVEAMLPEEKLVEAYIRSKSAESDSIEINKWGPHDLKGEILTVPGYQLVGERRRKPVVKVRVRYWMNGPDGKPQLNDRLYYLQDGEIFGSATTPFGTNWFETLRGVERQMHLRR